MLPEIADALAYVVAILHAAVLVIYIAGALSFATGGFSTARLQLWQRVYLVVVFAISLAVIGTDRCPLTRLENAARAIADPANCYSGSYIEHYVPIVSPMADQMGSFALMAAGCMATCLTLRRSILASRNRLTQYRGGAC